MKNKIEMRRETKISIYQIDRFTTTLLSVFFSNETIM
jgi:hypothetical protein